MKIKVNKEACVGCGACFSYAEDIFEINAEGVSQVKVDTVPEDKKEAVEEAIAGCPTGAIVEEK